MDKINYKLTWNEIYIMIDGRRYVDIDYLDLNFYIIICENYNMHNFIDWIHKEPPTKDDDFIDNILYEYNRTSRGRGKRKTAEMLWIYKDDKEKIALILFMMYIWQVTNNYPENWTRDVNKIYNQLLKVLFIRAKELNIQLWNNNIIKPMPSSLFSKISFSSIMAPENLEDILNIFTLEINYILNKYQLIKCTDPNYEYNRKKGIEKIKNMNLFRQ